MVASSLPESMSPNDVERSLEVALQENSWDQVELLVEKHGTKHLHMKSFVNPVESIHETKLHSLIRAHNFSFFLGRLDMHPNPSIRRLLVLDPSLAEDRSGSSLPCHLAVKSEDITMETLVTIIEAYPEALLKGDCVGQTPLHIAFNNLSRSPYFGRFPYEHLDDKRTCLVDTQPKAAAVGCWYLGNMPMHCAATTSSNGNPASVEMLRKLYQACPEAVRRRNKEGKFPLCLALEQKPVNKPFARALLALYDREPGKERWLFTTKASVWVRKEYSETYRSKWLTANSPAASHRGPVVKGQASKKQNQAEVPLVVGNQKQMSESFLAEEAIKLSFPWLATSRDLAAVSCASTFLHREVPKLTTTWSDIVVGLEKGLPLHAKEIVTEDFPKEFCDPRYRPDYGDLTPYQKAMFLEQYPRMMKCLIRAPKDEDAVKFMESVLEDIRKSAETLFRNLNQSGSNQAPFGTVQKPASVDELLRNVTLASISDYFEEKLLSDFLSQSMSGWCLDFVNGGWEGIYVNSFYHYFICKTVAGFEPFSHPFWGGH